MKTFKEVLIDRRSMRRYERQGIEQDKLEFIYEAIRSTQTSHNGQHFSVIAVTDQDVKLKLYEHIGQKQIKTSAVFLLFCMDFHQLRIAGQAKGIEAADFQNTMNGYTVGAVDATLAMHQAIVAAESMGLGTCCIGYVRTADPAKTAEILGLPEKVAVVCGLTIGWPSEIPDIKPKRPVALTVFENHYGDDAEIIKGIQAYDEQVCAYNQVRSGDKTCNDWVGHILEYHAEEKGEVYDEHLRKQGFDVVQK